MNKLKIKMQKLKLRIFSGRTSIILIFNFLFLIFLRLQSSAGDVAAGEELFKKRCRQCHKITEQLSTGPGLKDITKRRDIEWLDRWLKDPKKMMDSDPEAKELKMQFKKQMPKIPEMSDDDKRDDIIEYLKTL